MAFAPTATARIPLDLPAGRVFLTTLVGPRTIALATDRSVASPRFAPGLSTTHGGIPAQDPDVSCGEADPGWLSSVIARVTSCHIIWILSFLHSARADGHALSRNAFRALGDLVFPPALLYSGPIRDSLESHMLLKKGSS